jgi:hypothetical protein
MKRVYILIVLAGCMLNCRAQLSDPLSVAKKLFSRGKFPDSSRYITGEYRGHPDGNDIPADVKRVFKLLDQDKLSAVVNITLTDSTNKQVDAYLYFTKDTVWKASAFRLLAMSGIIQVTNYQLRSLNSAQVDSLISIPPDKNGIDHREFKTREEYNFELGNTSLVLASDDSLIAHFNKHKALFNRIKDELMAKDIMSVADGTKDMKGIDNIRQQMRSLFISEVEPDDKSNIDNLNFMIGGVLDNTVGYMYIKDKKNLPQISPSLFIMIKEIGDGWYLYKTT